MAANFERAKRDRDLASISAWRTHMHSTGTSD
jgi:hypothetical protein